MDLIYLFRRLVFAQVLLGIIAFCMAEQNPAMLLVAGALGALSWYVVEGPTGRPLPQWIILVGCFAAVAWLLYDIFYRNGHVIIAMGHFTMWLQILLLYAKKNNREYGEILVLNLLQMVGASVLSISFIYGLLLTAYCVLALFTVLIFQLKSTSDLVLEQNRAAAPDPNQVSRSAAVFGRGHRWQFRFTALVIGLLCAAVGVIVFLILPRTSITDFHSPIAPSVVRETGFSPQVQLTGEPAPRGSQEPVLNLQLSIAGQPVRGQTRPWLLRGAALDQYNPSDHTWTRSQSRITRDLTLDLPAEGQSIVELPAETPLLRATITLRENGPRALFTLYPITHLNSRSLEAVVFNPLDLQLSQSGSVSGAVVYEIQSPMVVPDDFQTRLSHRWMNASLGTWNQNPNRQHDRIWPVDTARIQQLALEVIRQAGLDRDLSSESDPRDEQIVHALMDYLRNNYRYALVANTDRAQPLSRFLFEEREGHCEMFASALAAMTRVLGLRSQVITGYLVSEYNPVGGYYVVRPTHAHAWTEVMIAGQGWRPFDATPPEEVALEHRQSRSWFHGLRNIYEHLEFIWINHFVAYDKQARQRMLSSLNQSFTNASTNQNAWLGWTLTKFRQLVELWQFDQISYTAIIVIVLAIIVGVISLIHTLIVRQRRLVALQLTSLPRAQRQKLVKRLKFYLVMLDILERHGYVRPPWQSPFAFAQELAEANPMKFDPVVALTELFYEIRFGYREFDQDRQVRADAHLSRLIEALPRRSAA